jgi:SRSO17 transposase
VVDDTGFAKKGTHSVGVGRQYSGTLGRTDNCQVATSLHVAGSRGSGCIGFRLYLPDAWTNDPERCRNAGVPDNRTFKTKWELALELLDEALATGVQRRTVLADAGYGEIPQFRDELTSRGLTYVVGVPGNHLIWPPGTDPQQPPRRAGKVGRPQTRWRDGQAQPIQIAKLVEGIARPRYRTVTWRDGTRGTMQSKFLAYRVRPAEGHAKGRPPAEQQWLLCEWPSSEKEPKFFFSTLPSSTSLRELVRLTKLRWRVERDYQELKGEVGLDHFEGRSWRGFHRHAALCAVAHAFLALRRALSPPVPRPVDPAGGTTSLAADSPAAHRLVPALRPSRRPPVASTSEVALMTPVRAHA